MIILYYFSRQKLLTRVVVFQANNRMIFHENLQTNLVQQNQCRHRTPFPVKRYYKNLLGNRTLLPTLVVTCGRLLEIKIDVG